MRYPLWIAVLSVCGTATACHRAPPAAPSVAAAQPYTLPDTEVRDIHATGLNRDYQIFVGLPDGYAEHPERTYPVLFVTDANYAFPLIRSIARRVGEHGEALQDFILIGLSYAKGDTPRYSRNRDYTPTTNGPNGPEDASDMPGRPFVYGQGSAYQAFVKNEVFPLVAKSYRADMSRRIYAGHSYGGLFGMDVLLSDPDMFDAYIIGSPSPQYDHHYLARFEQTYAAAHKDLKAKVFIATGGFETTGSDKRNYKALDLIGETNTVAKALASRHYPSLRVESHVIADEDHLTVFPDLITRGLVWSLGKAR